MRFVKAALDAHSSTLASRVAARLAPHAGGGAIAVDVPLGALLALVESSVATAVSSAGAHEAELADNGALLGARDEAVDGLYQSVTAAREAVTAAWGPAGLTAHGVSGPTPRQPDTLVAMARSFAAALVNEAVVLPPGRLGVTVDRGALGAKLASGAADLEQAEAAVRLDRREDEATQDAKDAALAAYDADFRDAVPVVVSLLRLAGLHRTADRLVPSPRRPGQLDDADTPLVVESPAPLTPA